MDIPFSGDNLLTILWGHFNIFTFELETVAFTLNILLAPLFENYPASNFQNINLTSLTFIYLIH